MTQTGQGGTVRFAAALSILPDTAGAVEQVCRTAMSQLGARPDLALVFVSPHHIEHLSEAAVQISNTIGCDNLIGCTGEAIVGGSREIEGRAAISLWLAALPGATVKLMHLEFDQTREGSIFTGWSGNLPEPWPREAAMLLMGEPFSFPADELVRRLNEDQPGIPILGGMASGGVAPGENQLVLGRDKILQGAVAALIYGDVRIQSVVSQGCRPIGQPYIITKCEANVVQELGGEPPLIRLKEILQTLSEEETQRVRRGLHLGRALSEYQDEFQRGDFLVRNVIGADPNTGAVAIGDYLRLGQTVQFHIRDEVTADDDLRKLLGAVGKTSGLPESRGALLFTCNGRGTRLFSSSNHDAMCLQETLGELPVAGFFAQGEIGPVGKQNFLHGYTASVAVFEAARREN
jgi:small ligand-binding sensory domain FIST